MGIVFKTMNVLILVAVLFLSLKTKAEVLSIISFNLNTSSSMPNAYQKIKITKEDNEIEKWENTYDLDDGHILSEMMIFRNQNLAEYKIWTDATSRSGSIIISDNEISYTRISIFDLQTTNTEYLQDTTNATTSHSIIKTIEKSAHNLLDGKKINGSWLRWQSGNSREFELRKVSMMNYTNDPQMAIQFTLLPNTDFLFIKSNCTFFYSINSKKVTSSICFLSPRNPRMLLSRLDLTEETFFNIYSYNTE